MRVYCTSVKIHMNDEYTPTPLVSFTILEHNKNAKESAGASYLRDDGSVWTTDKELKS